VGFRHELIRDALESAISPPRRASLHARVLAALESGPDGADNARLAHHAELAGLTGPASRYAQLAAADAARVGALREVWLQSERALRHGAGLTVDERFELLIQAARAANFSSLRMADGAAVAERAVALADEIGDPVKQARARGALAWPLWSLDRLEEAREVAVEAVSILQDGGDPGELARAHACHLRIEAAGFDPAVVADAGPRALALASAEGLDDVRIDIEISLGLARGHLGDPAALELLRGALHAARASGLTIHAIRAYVNLGFVGAALRDHATVEATLQQAVPMFEEARAMFPLAGLRTSAAISPLDRGQWDRAAEMIAWTLTFPNEQASFARAVRAVIGLRRGEPGARAVLERSWAELASLPDCSRHGFVRAALAEAAWLAAEPGLARAQIRSALESPRAAHFVRPYGDLALWAWRLGLELEPPADAVAPVLLELGGDWRGAIQAWLALDAPYEAALAALPGDDRAARDALAKLRRLGATGAARAFARERAAVGARAPRGPRRSTLANRAGLTQREQEVLEQLASGATNPEIACTLCLSERTVAHHVSAILAKLGAANRRLAIAQARERGLLTQDGPMREPR
jgi:DNA-binding CsgD family transcriptional regulator